MEQPVFGSCRGDVVKWMEKKTKFFQVDEILYQPEALVIGFIDCHENILLAIIPQSIIYSCRRSNSNPFKIEL